MVLRTSTRASGPRALALFAWALLLLAAALDAPAQNVGTLVLVRQQVLGSPPGGPARQLHVLDTVAEGTTLRTGLGALASLSLVDGGALELGQETTMLVAREAPGSGETQRLRFSRLEGSVTLALSPREALEARVDTTAAAVELAGSLVGVVASVERTLVAVFEGEALVTSKAGGDPKRVAEGLAIVVAGGSGIGPPAPIDPRDWVLSPAPGGPLLESEGNGEPPLQVEPPARPPLGTSGGYPP